jgi:putative transposase
MKQLKKAYKIEIKPTKEQTTKIRQTIGVSRFIYNFYIARNKEVSSKATKQAIMNGEKAFKKFFNGEAGFPKFKKKKDQEVKAYFPKNNKTDWAIERHRIKIPTLDFMRLKEFGYIPVNSVMNQVWDYQLLEIHLSPCSRRTVFIQLQAESL